MLLNDSVFYVYSKLITFLSNECLNSVSFQLLLLVILHQSGVLQTQEILNIPLSPNHTHTHTHTHTYTNTCTHLYLTWSRLILPVNTEHVTMRLKSDSAQIM